MTTKVLFFLAAAAGAVSQPSETEQAAIDALSKRYDEVAVRNANVSGYYGPRLESANALAGTPPAAYLTAIADYPDGNLGIPSANPSDGAEIYILPGTIAGTTSIAANGGTVQLRVVKKAANGVMAELVGGTLSFASGTPAKATVNSTGLVTGANTGAGTSVITATYTVDGKTCTATRTVTLT